MNKLTFFLLMSLLFCSDIAAQTRDTLIDYGDQWKYADKTKLDSIDWKASSYNDGTWNCGPAPLGYGDAWIATCISCGCPTEFVCSHPSTCSVNPTDYFRKKLKVSNTSQYDSVTIEGIIDDGMILYINGNSAWNYGVTTPSNYSTWASNNISGTSETTPVFTTISVSAFNNGDNQIAAELHQRAANTSDATFDLRFIFFKSSPIKTGLYRISDKKHLKIFPNPSSDVFTIETSDMNTNFYQIELFDLSGRFLTNFEGSFVQGRTVIHHNLDNGVFIGKLKTQNITHTFTLNIIK